MIYFFKILQLLVDLCLVVASFALAYFCRLSVGLIVEWKSTWIHSDYPIGDFYWNACVVAIFIFFVFVYQGRYSIDKPYKTIINNFVVSLLASTFFILIYFYNREVFFSRLIPVYAFWFNFVLLSLNHYLFKRIFSSSSFKQKHWIKTLIIGANQTAEDLVASLQSQGLIRNIVWVIDAYWTKKTEILWVPILGKMNKFEKVIESYWVEEILQADNLEQALNIVNFCENRGISYFLSPSLNAWLYHENLQIYYFDKNPAIYLDQTSLMYWNLIFKRVFDIFVAIVLLPLFLILSIIQVMRWRWLVKEKRISKWDVFDLYRFWANKTSVWEGELATADLEENAKTSFLEKMDKNWIQTSFFDRVLIKSHLVELAQIINVLRWEMSFVGPRPPFQKEYGSYQEFYKKRLKVKPWITWLWQISKSSEIFDFMSMYKKDIEYIKKWSFWFDLKIMLMTIFKVFR